MYQRTEMPTLRAARRFAPMAAMYQPGRLRLSSRCPRSENKISARMFDGMPRMLPSPSIVQTPLS